MRLSRIEFSNHPILKDLSISFLKPDGSAYGVIVFVGENGCGKTTLLNELFDYDNSKYIVRKEQNANLCGRCLHKSLFVAQDIKYRNAINSAYKKLKGSAIYNDITAIDNTNGYPGADVMTLNKDNVANTPVLFNESISSFDNDRIADYFIKSMSKHLMDDTSGLLKLDFSIDRSKSDTLSSGEQEIILRMEAIKNRVQSNLDMVLLDEPETSLHPKWQMRIVPFFLELLRDRKTGENDIQLFVASHSENVLKSAFKQEDTLIVRMYKEKEQVKSQTITNMASRLPETTIAEIQYLVFDIPSIEYHNQLYGALFSRFGEKQKLVENYLKLKYGNEILNSRNYEGKNGIETLPTYVRNASSHPENTERAYGEDDVKKSIEILRDAIEQCKG